MRRIASLFLTIFALAAATAAGGAGWAHTGAEPPSPSVDLAVRATSGMGMYVWRWERTGSVDEVVARAKQVGINHLIVRASSQSQGFYLAPILTELLPKAHAAGLQVVAYDPPRFEDIEADVARAQQLISFRVDGHGIDAFAADIEPAWERLTPENMDRYGARLREVAGPGYPLVAVVYPPNQVGARYPFAQAAAHFDVLSPMSYWRARTTDAAGFMDASIRQLAAFGKPVTAIGQAFSFDEHPQDALRPYPDRAEIDSAITAARAAGAVGMSFWVWEHAHGHVFEAIQAAAWGGAGPGVGTPPAVAPAPPAPVVAAAVGPAGPSVEEPAVSETVPEPAPAPVLAAAPVRDRSPDRLPPGALALFALAAALTLRDAYEPLRLRLVRTLAAGTARALLNTD